jgi:hypothetical protein
MNAEGVTASVLASNIQKRRPYRTLRRSPRLNRLPQLDEVTSQGAEQPTATAGNRQSLRPRLQSSTERVIKPSESIQNLIHVLQPRGQKRAREGHNLDNTKRRRTSSAPLVPEDQSQKTRDVDPIDYWRRSGYC